MKKRIAVILAICLTVLSVFPVSASALSNESLANVDCKNRVDPNDALFVLQYSVGKVRKFPANEFSNNVSGDMVPGSDLFESKEDLTTWLDRRETIPANIETFSLNGGFPIITANSDDIIFKSFRNYHYNYSAEYGKVEFYFDSEKIGDSVITALPTDRRLPLNLEAEFMSAYGEKYTFLKDGGVLQKHSCNGLEFFCWNSLKYTKAVCFLKKDVYVLLMELYTEKTWSDSILDAFNFETLSIEQQVKNKPTVQKTGDVNGDGKIDAEDALMILQYAVGKIDDFSEPPRDDFQELYPGGCVFYSCYGCRKEQNTYGQLPEGWIFSGGGIYCPDCQNKIQ